MAKAQHTSSPLWISNTALGLKQVLENYTVMKSTYCLKWVVISDTKGNCLDIGESLGIQQVSHGMSLSTTEWTK